MRVSAVLRVQFPQARVVSVDTDVAMQSRTAHSCDRYGQFLRKKTMTYNWEGIFENKSDKELYEIYCGDSFLPETTISIAKKELEKRNFDFNNIEIHKEVWKLSRLEEEIDGLKLELLRRTPISLKSYIFIIIFLVIFTAILSETINLENKSLFLSLIAGIVYITIIIIPQRYIYKKRVESLNKLLEKKSKLVDIISRKINLNERQHVLENLNEESEARIKQSASINKTLMIITAIIFLIYLVFRFLF